MMADMNFSGGRYEVSPSDFVANQSSNGASNTYQNMGGQRNLTPEQIANIQSYVQGNYSDPGAIARGMQQYGVSASDLSTALTGWNGLSGNDVQDWVSRIGVQTGNGAGFGGNTSTHQQAYTDWHNDAQAREQQRQSLLAGVPSSASANTAAPSQYSTMPMTSGSGQSNPYIGSYANAITNQVTQNLQRNILPGISSGAMSAGGFGGSRQGVVEANALNDANQGLSNALAGVYSSDWNNQQGRDLQRYGMDQSYNLGMGNLGLNYQNSQNNFYTAQRGQDLQAAGLGAQLAQMANQGFLGQGQGLYNVGTTTQQAPWGAINNFTGAARPFTGFGSDSSSTSSNPWASAIGGAYGGAQLFNLFK